MPSHLHFHYQPDGAEPHSDGRLPKQSRARASQKWTAVTSRGPQPAGDVVTLKGPGDRKQGHFKVSKFCSLGLIFPPSCMSNWDLKSVFSAPSLFRLLKMVSLFSPFGLLEFVNKGGRLLWRSYHKNTCARLSFINVFFFSFVTAERLDNTDAVHSNCTFSGIPQEVPATMEKHSKKKKKRTMQRTRFSLFYCCSFVSQSRSLLFF